MKKSDVFMIIANIWSVGSLAVSDPKVELVCIIFALIWLALMIGATIVEWRGDIK